MNKVLVIGANGLIGLRIVEQLIKQHYKVSAGIRSDNNKRLLINFGAAIIHLDVTDKASLNKAIKGHEIIINCSGLYSFWEKNPQHYYDINSFGVKNIAEAVLENGIDKFIHLSAAGVWGNLKHTTIHEDIPPSTKQFSHYFYSKLYGDNFALALLNKGLKLCILYPCSVIAENDQSYNGQYLEKLIQQKLPSLIFPDAVIPFVDVEDVAQACLKSIEHAEFNGDQYIIGKHHRSLLEYSQQVCNIANTQIPQHRISNSMAITLGKLFNRLSSITGKHPLWGMSYEHMYFLSQLCNGIRVNTERSEKKLKIEYTPFSTSLERIINHYL